MQQKELFECIDMKLKEIQRNYSNRKQYGAKEIK